MCILKCAVCQALGIRPDETVTFEMREEDAILSPTPLRGFFAPEY